MDNIDETLEKVVQLGGKIVAPKVKEGKTSWQR
jgi:predicted enzyme related to lactoylglutathione lyase